MVEDAELHRVLQEILNSTKFHQALLHDAINKNNDMATQLNDVWIALDKVELSLRRILQ